MHLLVTFLVAAVIASQHLVSAQCSPQCSCGSPDGTWSPLYRMLTSPLPSENDIVPRSPPRCSCGCSPRRLPSPQPNTAQQSYRVSTLSGVVMDSPVFQQVGPPTVIQTPPAMYVSRSDIQDSTPHTCDSSSTHIMTIPRKHQDSSVTFTSYETPSNTVATNDDAAPSVTYCTAPNAIPAVVFSSTSNESPTTTYSMTPQQMPCQPPHFNSGMSAPQPNLASQRPQPQQIYFTQPAPLFASCPATLFYPAAPAMTCAQPNYIYPATPSCPFSPEAPTISQSFTPETSSHTTYSTSVNSPTTTNTMKPSQNIPCNAPQSVLSSSQPFTAGYFQSTPSNSVPFSTSDVQQTPINSVSCNSNHQQKSTNSANIDLNPQQTPSNTIFFHDSGSNGGSETALPETTSPTVTSPLTYTLMTSGTNNEVTDASRDCSVPVPPTLV